MYTGHLFINYIRFTLGGSSESDKNCLNGSLPDPVRIFIINCVIIKFGLSLRN